MKDDKTKIVEFPLPEIPPADAANPYAYTVREWVYALRVERKEVRDGLASGKYSPTPDFMASLDRLEALLEEYQYI